MGELSLGFHLLSLFVLVGLVLWVLRLQVMIKTWREWSLPQASARIVVAEPLRAIRQFACSIGCGFETEVPARALPPVKISMRGLFDIHRQFGIRAIKVSSGTPVEVCFVLSQEPGTIAEALPALTRELGGNMRLTIENRSP
jgi:hypothetical protein